MKILHIALMSPYTDDWTYQENILTKYHKKMGYQVMLIVPNLRWNENGEKETIGAEHYFNQDGVEVIRLVEKFNAPERRFRRFPGLYETLENFNPDIIFIHGCQFIDIYTIKMYLKKHKVIAYLDNHADYNNSASNFLSKHFLHRVLWKFGVQQISPYIDQFYGVTPSRVEFLIKEYKLPVKKVDLLIMGADDETIDEVEHNGSKDRLRQKHNLSEDDFIIIAGGKIDANRSEYLNLIRAVKEFRNPKVHLIIFGSFSDDVKDSYFEKFDEQCYYVGWLNKREIYEYISFANLAVFPCLHSVMWEETAGIGTPALYRDLQGFHHLVLDDNCLLLKDGSVQTIRESIELSMNNYEKMKKKALEVRHIFLYSEIAQKSIKQYQ